MGFSTRLRSALGLAALAAMLGTASAPLAAQATGTVRGTVTDASTQRPLSGAQVSVVGSNRRAVTNAAGEYTLANVPAGALSIRAEILGYGSSSRQVSVAAGQTATQNFALSTSTISLDALVVTGTPGATEKRAIGNAVANVDAATIVDQTPVQNVSQLLQARAAGLTVMPGGGTAGAASSIRIRGTGSLEAGNRPIFYVDGIRMNADLYDPGVLGQMVSPLDAINPEDIESIEVIKGPAAATLYGAEAASGVIQIITKKGRVGDQKIQWSLKTEQGRTNWAAGMPTNFRRCTNARIAISGPGAGTRETGCAGIDPTSDTLSLERIITDQPLPRAINDGEIQNYSVSARGGGDRYSFYVSADRDHETGLFSNNFVKRTTARSNFFVSPKDNLDLALNLNFGRTHTRFPLNNNASAGWLRNAFRGFPGQVTTATWEVGWRGLGPEQMALYDNQIRNDRVVIGATANWQPISWFRNRITAGLDAQELQNTEFYRPDLTGRAPYGADAASGQIYQGDNFYRDYTFDYAGTLSFDLPREISSNTSFGMQMLARRYRQLDALGINMLEGQSLVSNAAQTFSGEGYTASNSVGVFVQEQLGWKNRLFVTGAVRADDNSTFGTDFDRVLYPKASLSYVISEEDWFGIGAINELKLRTAWGRAGNSPGAFQADRTYTSLTLMNEAGGVDIGLTPASFGNPDLTAETGQELEVGFDASLFNSRLGIEATYYNKQTKDALLRVQVAPSSGFAGSRLENVGELFNRGFELSLFGSPIQGKNVSLESRATFHALHNEFTSFGGTRDNTQPLLYGYTNEGQQVREGYPVAGYWAVDFLYNPDGTIQTTNAANGARIPTALFEDTARFIGSSTPTREMSLANTLTLFGNLQLYAFVDYKGGHYQHNLTQQFRDNDQNTWEMVNPDTTLANRLNKAGRGFISDIRYIEKADFVKLREVSLTYNLPKTWTRGFGSEGVSLTLAGRNLKTWTDYSGYDPEGNIEGAATFERSDYMGVPALRTWVATVNVRF